MRIFYLAATTSRTRSPEDRQGITTPSIWYRVASWVDGGQKIGEMSWEVALDLRVVVLYRLKVNQARYGGGYPSNGR